MAIITLVSAQLQSLPTRGGWIEIEVPGVLGDHTTTSLPTRGGWIEMRR